MVEPTGYVAMCNSCHSTAGQPRLTASMTVDRLEQFGHGSRSTSCTRPPAKFRLSMQPNVSMSRDPTGLVMSRSARSHPCSCFAADGPPCQTGRFPPQRHVPPPTIDPGFLLRHRAECVTTAQLQAELAFPVHTSWCALETPTRMLVDQIAVARTRRICACMAARKLLNFSQSQLSCIIVNVPFDLCLQ